MIRATAIVRRPAVRPDRVADTITLDHAARHRRRVALTADGGLAFLLDLDRATALDDGDAVKLEDGRLVQVRAAPEQLIEVRTANPLRLMKVGWHLGNRHVAAEIAADAIYIAHDHVLLEMVRGLGATATAVERPFRPEQGAYAPEAGHDHGGHGHHGHDHAAPAGPSGAACGCGDDHAVHAHTHDHAAHGHSGHAHHGHEHHGHAHHDHGSDGHAHDHSVDHLAHG